MFLCNRTLDPIFAMSIGIAAAAVRIKREEKEKGRDVGQSFEAFKSRWALVIDGDWGEGKGSVASVRDGK